MKNILFILLCAFTTMAHAQDLERTVLGSAGKSKSVGDVTLSWTFGESIIQTYSGNGTNLTQGFQQPSMLDIVSVDEILYVDTNSYTGDTLLCGMEIPLVEPVVISNCPEGYTATYEDSHGVMFCHYIVIRIWTIIDNCGNETSWLQSFNTPDFDAPVLVNDLPADVYTSCGSAPGTYEPMFSDCDTALILVHDITIENPGCAYVIIHTWTATDDCGLSTTVTLHEHFEDEHAPIYTGPAQMEYWISCNEEIPHTTDFTDDCDADLDFQVTSTVDGNTTTLTFTATDDCGNSTSVIYTVHQSCCEPPVLISELPTLSLECGEELPPIETPEFEDVSDDALEITFSIDSIAMTCGWQIKYVWIATNTCGASTEAVQIISITDTTTPTFIGSFEDMMLSCNDPMPEIIAPQATDNCDDTVTIVPTIVTTTGECAESITQVSYTAYDDCGNQATVSYSIIVSDNEEPVFSSCPDELILPCGSEIPDAPVLQAVDNCDADVTILYEEFYMGNEPVEGAVQQCDLLTPVRPANNPCGYPVDWAMALFGLPTAHRYYYVSEGSFVQMEDGTIHVQATLYNVYNPANGWNLHVTFANEMTWNQWSTQNTPHGFKAGCGANGANHFDWLYYLLQNTPGAELTGIGGYAGSLLSMLHAPANNYFGFQLGNDANNYNSADNAFGGWFTYSGTFLINGANYATNGYISGAGDLAFELDCCPSYELVRQWTAVDCSGNTTTCTQQVILGDTSGNEVQNQPSSTSTGPALPTTLEISASPNPADHMVTFVFNVVETDRTSLEIVNLAGERVAVVYQAFSEADTRQVVEYDTSTLAAGIYFYSLINGNAALTGKLIVTH